MTSETDTTISSRATGLVGGILSDGEVLFKQGMALMRCEIAHDLDSARRAVILMAVGVVFSVAGLTLLCFAMVHLLSAYFPGVALWVFFATVGALVSVVAALLAFAGALTMRTLSQKPKSVEAIKEQFS